MIALNHSFLRGIAHAAPQRAFDALNLVEHVRRRTLELPRVHETLAGFDTGAGSLIQWANRHKADTSLGPLVELMLRGLSGPFLPEKHFEGPVEPSLDLLDEWLVELIRRLLAASQPTTRGGLLSPSPTGGATWRATGAWIALSPTGVIRARSIASSSQAREEPLWWYFWRRRARWPDS
jgi:hypothetical protein